METIPLYDRVKNQVYDEYQRLKRQHTIVFNARSKRKKVLSLKMFRAKYLKFFYEIYSLSSYDFLSKEVKAGLEKYGNNVELINNLDKIGECVMFSTIAIRELKITKIHFDKDYSSF